MGQERQHRLSETGTRHGARAFRLTPETLDEVRRHTAHGDKYLPQLLVDVVDQQGEVVARVHKTLYVKRKKDEAARRPVVQRAENGSR